MCGRFTQAYTWSEIVAFLRLLAPAGAALNLRPRYNIAPTTDIDVVIDRGKGRELVKMRWGMIPRWWKKSPKELPATFNARAESVAEKPMFRDSFRSRRCIIPASGFYEWTGPRTNRQPFYFTSPSGEPLAFAGLWDRWRNPETGEDVQSCTIVVTDANLFMREYHDRMPVVLAEGDFDAWLSGNAGLEILRPAPEDVLRAWKVSQRVNRAPKFDEPDDDPTLIEPQP
jgi:putative SOS response-associated peptidase YedK